VSGATILQFPAMETDRPESLSRAKTREPNRLREWRKLRGLTLDTLAAAPRVGLTKQHLSKLETGKRELTKPVMERLAEALGCDQADLLNPEDGGLTEEERRFVTAYRLAGEGGRNAIRAVAESQMPFVHGEPEELRRKAG
jgi:transcriptional regulator with XRE-family HTH domain